MHPSRPLVAVGLVTGRVQVFEAGKHLSTAAAAASTAAVAASAAATASTPTAPVPLVNLRASSSSSRAVAFSADGSALYVGDAEGTLTSVDVATGKASARLPAAATGGSAFTRLVAALLSSNASSSSSPFLPATSVVSGDEAGTVRVWDPRSSEPAFEFARVHGGEQVSDLLSLPAGAAAGLKSSTPSSSSGPASTAAAAAAAAATTTTGGLVSVGGDGTLALLDFARAVGKGARSGGGCGSGGVASRSDADEDELLSLCPAKNFSTLCAGSAGGVLSLWKPKAAGGLAGCADRLPLPRLAAREGGDRPAVNSLAPLDGCCGGGGGGGKNGGGGGGGSLLLAGCADGKVRVLSVLPNRVLCTLGGAHGEGREVLRVRTGGGAGGGAGSGRGGGGGGESTAFPLVAASVAAPSKSLCLWSCEALRASASEAASAVAAGVGGKRARRRRAEEEDESDDDDDDEEDDDGGDDGEESDEEDDGAAPKKGKAAASRPGSFFDGIVS